jgi:integrase
LLQRIEAVVNKRGEIDMREAEALLGGVPVPALSVSDALDEFWKIEAIRFKGKSEDQIRRAKNPRIKAIENFVKAVGNRPYLEVTTADLQAFKRWWKDRVIAEGLSHDSANKDFTYLTSTLRAVATDAGVFEKIQWTTKGLALPKDEPKTRKAFSTAWISDKLLAPGALDGLNGEARAILLGTVNTGYRPSEGAGLTAAQIRLDANVPHIRIEPVGRTLKTAASRRVIPLLGVSLEAFRAYPNGFPRYANSPSLTDTLNKFMREKGLLESEEHTLYGLRHSFEDRMLSAGIDERIRRDLMGHSLRRERYGEGASLEQLAALLKPLCL